MTAPTPDRTDEASTPDLAIKTPLTDKERDFYQAYYLLQSQRQGQHETNRLVVSNFILAGSLAALGFAAAKEGLPGWVVGIVLVSVALANIMATVYARQSRYWVKLHQKRARYVLQQLSPKLVAMQDEVGAISRKKMLAKKSGNGSFLFDAFRSERVQSSIHWILVLGIAFFFWLASRGIL